MQAVFERLVAELEKPRPLTPQCLRHLAGTYGVGRDETGAFLDQQLPELSEAEIDLALSSLFTPKLADQVPFAELLGDQSIPPEELPAWIERLHARPTLGCLATEQGSQHRFPLRLVTLERYVHRLRLEGSVPTPLHRLIQTLLPGEDRPYLLAIARRAIWNTAERQEILESFLGSFLFPLDLPTSHEPRPVSSAGFIPSPALNDALRPPEGGTTNNEEFMGNAGASDSDRRKDAEALLTLMESAEPLSVEDIQMRLPEWERNLRTQLTTGAMPRPFFNLQVEEMHGGGRDHRPANTSAVDRRRAELEFLGRLARRLGVSQ